MTNCPCSSNKKFNECCEPFILGKAWPPTAEALMRSRYTAYTHVDVTYIKKTSAPELLKEFDAEETRKWAQDSEWLGLNILSTTDGTAQDQKGFVEFVATFVQDGKTVNHHEVSQFRKDADGHWLFVDGAPPATQATLTRAAPKVGRNDVCPCGSGKKFKKCCEGAKAPSA